MSYKTNIKENLDFMKSHLGEWVYTKTPGPVRAKSIFVKFSGGRCELCGKEPIKEQFAVERITDKTIMMVGSECVRQFDASKGKSALEIDREQFANRWGMYCAMGAHIIYTRDNRPGFHIHPDDYENHDWNREIERLLKIVKPNKNHLRDMAWAVKNMLDWPKSHKKH